MSVDIEREVIFHRAPDVIRIGRTNVSVEEIIIYKTDCPRTPIEMTLQCPGFEMEHVVLTPDMVKAIRAATNEDGTPVDTSMPEALRFQKQGEELTTDMVIERDGSISRLNGRVADIATTHSKKTNDGRIFIWFKEKK